MLGRTFARIVLFGIAALVPAHAIADTRVALVIGNSDYANVPGLRNPVSDADLVAAALKRAGFAATDVVVLKNLNGQTLKGALESFATRARSADVAVVYFAGHGMEMGGINYLIPVDAKLSTDADVAFEAVPLDLALAAAGGARRMQLVVMDACRDNPFAVRMRSTGAKRSVSRGLAAIEPGGNTLVLYSARDGTTAEDGSGANSPFAVAFAHDIDQPVEIGKLIREVRDDVLASTRQEQEPFLYGSLSSSDFYFVAPAAGSATAPTAPAATSIDPRAMELALWQSVSESNDVTQLQSYLDKYPNGTFSEAARAKIVALNRPAAPPAQASPSTSVPTSGQIVGAGATFPYPIYARWAASYLGVGGVSLNYQAIGSGGGIKQIEAKTVTFGATDVPLQPADLQSFGLVQFPTVLSAIVPVVNVPGVAANSLVLNGSTLADIYLGKVARWDDPEIARLNPTVRLPSLPIAPMHRSDGSGTTYYFTTYLAQNSDTWRQAVGAATSVNWPTGSGRKGNQGVASQIAETVGAIGYVEYAYAKQNHLVTVRLLNRSSVAVTASEVTVQAAVESALNSGTFDKRFFQDFVDPPGVNSWPLTMATYVVMERAPSNVAAATQAVRFFRWAIVNGGRPLSLELDYVPLPGTAVKLTEISWSWIQGVGK